MKIPTTKVLLHFLLSLLIISFSSTVRASRLFSVMLKIDARNLHLLTDVCYQSGARFFFSVESDNNNQGHQYDGIIFIKPSANTVSFFHAPAYAYGIDCNSAGDFNFGLFFPVLNMPDTMLVRYTIFRSFWMQLLYTSKQNNKFLEAGVALSLFQSSSDVEVLLLFSLNNLDGQFISEAVEYVNGFCNEAGWKCKVVNNREDGSRYLRLIIPLGEEDKNNNNFQSLELDKRVSLEITKSGLRKKGSNGSDSMLYFPSLVQKISAAEEHNPVDIFDNPEDYSALIMSSAEGMANVWIFPRQSEQWKAANINTEAGVISTDEIPMQINELSTNEQQLAKKFLMALSGCFSDPEKESFNKVQTYLKELGYEVHNMPSDNYCGWHAVAHWAKAKRPDLVQAITDDAESLTAESVFNFFSNRAQKMVLNGDNREFIRSLASEMNGSGSQRTWLDYRHLRYLLSPFIQQNILLFDMMTNRSDINLPFRVDLLSPGEDSTELRSREEVVRAISENQDCMMLLHSSNHWLLIIPGHRIHELEATSLPNTIVPVGLRNPDSMGVNSYNTRGW